MYFLFPMPEKDKEGNLPFSVSIGDARCELYSMARLMEDGELESIALAGEAGVTGMIRGWLPQLIFALHSKDKNANQYTEKGYVPMYAEPLFDVSFWKDSYNKNVIVWKAYAGYISLHDANEAQENDLGRIVTLDALVGVKQRMAHDFLSSPFLSKMVSTISTC